MVSAVKVYRPPNSAAVSRVLDCLLEKDVQFQLNPINLVRGEQKKPDYLKLQHAARGAVLGGDCAAIASCSGGAALGSVVLQRLYLCTKISKVTKNYSGSVRKTTMPPPFGNATEFTFGVEKRSSDSRRRCCEICERRTARRELQQQIWKQRAVDLLTANGVAMLRTANG
ncbi:unnamed protein product [Fraxinus pennsylvanica]|uniref:Uncharacterized protein n=1 Tax=Fraxinus pennsylvanica TaxID=56036 RepID=A0AAD2EA64_9LAMI|nr:unnamed protein product [Fraxinus pennsylvanica]